MAADTGSKDQAVLSDLVLQALTENTQGLGGPGDIIAAVVQGPGDDLLLLAVIYLADLACFDRCILNSLQSV